MSEVTFEVPQEALAQLDQAMAADGFTEDAVQSTGVAPPDDGFDPHNQGLPQGETQTPNAPTPPAQEAQPGVAPETPETPGLTQPTETGESFAERFDPTALPEELLPAYRLMQADYTRKRQADAEMSRLIQQYPGVDLGQAVQLFQTIQDPDGLVSFVQNASEWLAEAGHAEFVDDGSPTPVAQPQEQDNLQQALTQLANDPELAPLASTVQQLQQQLSQMQSEQQQRLAAEREEAQVLQAFGEIQRQENVILRDNPQYDDGDMSAIYEIASHYDGDLFTAQQRYEAMFASRLGRYMQQKQAVPEPPVPHGLPQPVQQQELTYDPLDPKQAHEAAMEVARLIEQQTV